MPHQCTNCGHVFEDGSKEMLSGCPDCGGNKFQYHPGEVVDESPSDEEPPEPPEPEGGTVTGAVGRAANKVRDAVTSNPEPAERTSGDAAETADSAEAADAADSSGRDGATVDRASGSDATADSPSAPETGGASEAPSTDANADAADAGSTDAVDADAADAEAEPGATDAEVDAGMADSEDTAQADARSEVVDRDSLPDAPSDGRVVKEPDDPEERPDLSELRAELNDQFESIRIVAPGQYELNLMELYDRQEYIIALQEDGQYVIEVPDAWDAEDV